MERNSEYVGHHVLGSEFVRDGSRLQDCRFPMRNKHPWICRICHMRLSQPSDLKELAHKTWLAHAQEPHWPSLPHIKKGAKQMLQPWIKRLLQWRLVKSAGRTKSTRCYVDLRLLQDRSFVGDTTLKRIEPHRLAALLVEDIVKY